MQWQDEKTLQDVEVREENWPDTGFLSRSNYIKKHKEDPIKRYEVAQQFLPWPLGFKESVLALRAIMRDKKKQNASLDTELNTLYRLAAWESFCPKHSTVVDQPGYKVFDRIPGGKIAELPVDYQQLGYEQLRLLTKTDKKMLVNSFGEPEQHSTLNELYPTLWQQAEMHYLKTMQPKTNDIDQSSKTTQHANEVKDKEDEGYDKISSELTSPSAITPVAPNSMSTNSQPVNDIKDNDEQYTDDKNSDDHHVAGHHAADNQCHLQQTVTDTVNSVDSHTHSSKTVKFKLITHLNINNFEYVQNKWQGLLTVMRVQEILALLKKIIAQGVSIKEKVIDDPIATIKFTIAEKRSEYSDTRKQMTRKLFGSPKAS